MSDFKQIDNHLSTIKSPRDMVGTTSTLTDQKSQNLPIELKPLRPNHKQSRPSLSQTNAQVPITVTNGSDALQRASSRRSLTATHFRIKDQYEKIVLKPLPPSKGAPAFHQPNTLCAPGRDISDSHDSSLNGLDVEPNGMEVEEDEALTTRPPVRRATNRRCSRSRRSAIFVDDKGAQSDFGLGLQGGDAVHEERRKEIARSRWIKAIWYASEEAHRRRAERKALLKNLGTLQRAQMRRGSGAGYKGSSTDLTGNASPISSPIRNRQSSSPPESSSLGKTSHARDFESIGQYYGKYFMTLRALSSFLASVSLFYLIYVVDWYIILVEEASVVQAAAVHSLMAVCFFVFIGDLVISIVHSFQWNVFLFLDILLVLCSIPDFIYSLLAIIGPSLDTYAGLIYAVRIGKSLELSIRVGTRTSRAIRVVNLINKLRRVGPMRKIADSNAVDNSSENTKEDVEHDVGCNSEQRGSGSTSIGVVLENSISSHHLLVVCVMLLSKWVSEVLVSSNRTDHARSDLEFLVSSFGACNVTRNCQSLILQSFAHKILLNGQRLLFLKVNGEVLYGNETQKDIYREYPYPEIIVAESGSGQVNMLHLVDRQHIVMECWSHTMEATVLIFFLLIFTTSLSTMILSHIISPLSRIVKTVLALEVDPLRPLHRKLSRNSAQKDIYEVSLIENALHKIAALMQLGFGEAGANIIQENMRLGDALQVNSDVAGKVVHAIYGFCDIRNFTDCTEVLQVDVVKLVNQVASIVHESVVKNLGAPNKNIGDAFLLVWKPKGSHSITEVAESALRSYIRIIIEISRCKKLERWARKKQIQARMPGFQLKMGFGMHYGWAIEGAIGSLHKIDASYLSPHVNIASRLESATKQFGVYILFSEDVYALLSSETQNLCRRVDRVTLKGSVKPMKLYTYDVPVIKLRGGTLDDDVDVSSPSVRMQDFFNDLAPPYTDSAFRNLWAFAMDLYCGGPTGSSANWITARRIAQDLLAQIPDDGPTKSLLAVMDKLQQRDGSAPEDWRGYRSLDEK